MMFQPCRFCGGRGCLSCDADRLRAKEEWMEAENRAVRALISNPRFREILNAVLAEERNQEAARCSAQARSDGASIFEYIEMASPVVPQLPEVKPLLQLPMTGSEKSTLETT